MYLFAIARLTVVSCTPTMSAICVMSGLKWGDALFRKWRLRLDDLARDALDRALARSIESIRNFPERMRSLRYRARLRGVPFAIRSR